MFRVKESERVSNNPNATAMADPASLNNCNASTVETLVLPTQSRWIPLWSPGPLIKTMCHMPRYFDPGEASAPAALPTNCSEWWTDRRGDLIGQYRFFIPAGKTMCCFILAVHVLSPELVSAVRRSSRVVLRSSACSAGGVMPHPLRTVPDHTGGNTHPHPSFGRADMYWTNEAETGVNRNRMAPCKCSNGANHNLPFRSSHLHLLTTSITNSM